ncbi:MAG TPA: heme-binding protein [Aliidongia sp.]|nr:heme-binding protein [Aliidongia sp.]
MRLFPILILVLLFADRPVFAQTAPLTRSVPVLTRAGAQSALQAAERLATESHDPAAIAVVDADGQLLAFDRMDDVRSGSGDLAIGKARSAALMQRPTEELEANVASGRVGLATAGLTALRGGAPLKVDGIVVGAVGIAGRSKEDDARTAAAVADGFGAAP